MTKYVRFSGGTKPEEETWYQLLDGKRGLLVYSTDSQGDIGREFDAICGPDERDCYHSIRTEYDESEVPDEVWVAIAKFALGAV